MADEEWSPEDLARARERFARFFPRELPADFVADFLAWLDEEIARISTGGPLLPSFRGTRDECLQAMRAYRESYAQGSRGPGDVAPDLRAAGMTPASLPAPRLKPAPKPPVALPSAVPQPCDVCGLLCRTSRETIFVEQRDPHGSRSFRYRHVRCPRRFWRPLVRLVERMGF